MYPQDPRGYCRGEKTNMKIFSNLKLWLSKHPYPKRRHAGIPRQSEVQLNQMISPKFSSDSDCPVTQFRHLNENGNSYCISEKRPFSRVATLKPSTIEKVFDFAYEMAFTDKHRNTRSGGSKGRTNGEIFANTFQGKIAECAACNFFFRYDSDTAPDFGAYEKGIWDSVDLAVCGKQIAVKSTKHFGQLLLLETKDWDEHGRYIPNIGKSVCTYDYLMLVRIAPNCEDLLRQQRFLYSDQIDRERLRHICCSQKWEYDYAGYITQDELIYIIRNNHILPKNSVLNGKTTMDAENYYVQAADMHEIESLEGKF